MEWDASMKIWKRIGRTPLTMLLLIGLATVFMGTHAPGENERQSPADSRRAWGCLEALVWVPSHVTLSTEPLTDLSGPFDLWDGQWWRIPLSTYHHANLLHLFLNSLFLATYGALLERLWGSGRYLLFNIAAAVASSLPTVLLGDYGIGYSGVCCAIYGALWGARYQYPHLLRLITDEHIAAMLLALVMLLILSELGLMPVDNLAHFTGLAYGWLIGMAVTLPTRQPWLMRGNMVLAHGLLAVPLWYAVHPEWNGSYHWYLATRGADHRPRRTVDIIELRRAVACDPSLAGAWQMLAEQELHSDQPLLAWQDLLAGLAHQPTDARLWNLTRRVWRRLSVSPQRDDAVAIAERQFGDRTSIWLDQIRELRRPPLLIAPDQPPRLPPEEVAEQPTRQPWVAPDDPYWWRRSLDSPERTRSIPADDPRSAREGESL